MEWLYNADNCTRGWIHQPTEKQEKKIMDCTCDPLRVVAEVCQWGPRRVVITERGYSVPYHTARKLYDISLDIMLIRKDGYTLGAPLDLSDVARSLYPDCWLGFVVDGGDVVHDMKR